jgi:hypothetical protein
MATRSTRFNFTSSYDPKYMTAEDTYFELTSVQYSPALKIAGLESQVCLYICTHIHLYIRTHTHIHMHTFTYVHTHTYTFVTLHHTHATLHYTTHHITLHYASHHTTLHYTKLHYTTPHYTTLHCRSSSTCECKATLISHKVVHMC